MAGRLGDGGGPGRPATFFPRSIRSSRARRRCCTLEERHATRPETVAAAWGLLAEHAHRFDLRVTLSARGILHKLEWVPIRDRKQRDEEDEE